MKQGRPAECRTQQYLAERLHPSGKVVRVSIRFTVHFRYRGAVVVRFLTEMVASDAPAQDRRPHDRKVGATCRRRAADSCRCLAAVFDTNGCGWANGGGYGASNPRKMENRALGTGRPMGAALITVRGNACGNIQVVDRRALPLDPLDATEDDPQSLSGITPGLGNDPQAVAQGTLRRRRPGAKPASKPAAAIESLRARQTRRRSLTGIPRAPRSAEPIARSVARLAALPSVATSTFAFGGGWT